MEKNMNIEMKQIWSGVSNSQSKSVEGYQIIFIIHLRVRTEQHSWDFVYGLDYDDQQLWHQSPIWSESFV